MSNVSVRDARKHFSMILDRVERGEEITVTRYGQAIARIVPERRGRLDLGDMAAFRASLQVHGSQRNAVVEERRELDY